MEEESLPVINKNIEKEQFPSDDNERIPEKGMSFDSEEELYDYYKKYAYQVGFGVRKTCYKTVRNGEAKYYTLACSKGGKYVPKINSKLLRVSIKTECKANISVIVNRSGRCTISRISLEHNHDLSPKKARYHMSHKEIDSYSKRRLELNDHAGIPPNKNFHSLVVEAEGYENLTFCEKDCRNYIAKVRQLRLGAGDADALQNYFACMKKRNPNFYSVIDINDEGRLRNVFWADARSRAAYESFGDVLSFDSTYLTNKYSMPFAPFVGVNHHGQSILFGCALLSREDIDTYVWLFRSWLDCMCGRAPKAIITDQDKSMKAAIAEVFPESHHRLCLWHIMKKVPEKLCMLKQYKEIKKTLKSIVYESLDPHEFDDEWSKLIKDYGLEENKWLSSLFADRRQWVSIYVRGIFWAGMSTTQRSESMNSFFDGFVNSKTSLRLFVEQYDQALRSKVEKENKADFDSLNSSYQLFTRFNIEKQFQQAYTNEIFKLFQAELQGMGCCNSMLLMKGVISTYNVTDIVEGKNGGPDRKVLHTIYYNEVECDIRCSCLLFEFRGIICRHMVKILIEKDVKEIPSRYILTQWRKDVKHRHYFVVNCYKDLAKSEQATQYNSLCATFSEIAHVANSQEKYEFLMTLMEKARERLNDDSHWGEAGQASVQASLVRVEFHNALDSSGRLLSPLKVRSKGRPPSKRKESTFETTMKKKKKTKQKKPCGEKEVTEGPTGPWQNLVFAQPTQIAPTQYLEALTGSWQNLILSQQSQVKCTTKSHLLQCLIDLVTRFVISLIQCLIDLVTRVFTGCGTFPVKKLRGTTSPKSN